MIMKRDMELIRLLLLKQEIGEAPPELAKYSVEEKLYNLQLMDDANLIVVHFGKGNQGEVVDVDIRRLTWAGHDFLDATKDSKIWKKAMEHIIKPGVSWTFQTLLEYLKREIDQRFLGGGSQSQ
jgi:hypothetical protein